MFDLIDKDKKTRCKELLHFNTYKTTMMYLKKKALLSRKELYSIGQADDDFDSQKSDNLDEMINIDDYSFFDLVSVVEISSVMGNEKSKRRLCYGYFAFELSKKYINETINENNYGKGYKITKDNPVNISEISSDDNLYFNTLSEYLTCDTWKKLKSSQQYSTPLYKDTHDLRHSYVIFSSKISIENIKKLHIFKSSQDSCDNEIKKVKRMCDKIGLDYEIH